MAGPVEIIPVKHGDDRGYFTELFREDRFNAALAETGTWSPVRFVQENQSLSVRKGTVRGLHFQTAPAEQGKLVRCLQGAILDVAVDLRRGSPGFGRFIAVELTAEACNQLWIPVGFAHGFCTLTSDTVVAYRVTGYYSAAHDKGVAWDDPAIGIAWPDCCDPATLSAKDRVQPRLQDLHDVFEREQ